MFSDDGLFQARRVLNTPQITRAEAAPYPQYRHVREPAESWLAAA